MNKLIGKTIGFTVTIILSLLVIAFSVVSIFFPLKMASAFNFFGFKSAELKYLQQAYEKDKNINELANIIELSNIIENKEVKNNSLKEMLLHDELIKFCKFKNGNIEINSPYSKLTFYTELAKLSLSAETISEIINELSKDNSEDSNLIIKKLK